MVDKKKEELKSVKVRQSVLNLVKKHKNKTHFPIGIFFEQAALEKLARENNNET